MSGAKFLKKITPATVTKEVGIDLLSLPRPVEARVLYDLYGIISRYKTGNSTLGAWLRFTGQFEAVTPDGEVFSSSGAHIPVLEDLLHSQLLMAQQADPKATLQVAIRVGIKAAPKGKPSATGYEFDVQPLMQSSENNPVALLRAQVEKDMPARIGKIAPTDGDAEKSDGKSKKGKG